MIFDGVSLSGWHATPRLPVPSAPGQPQPDTTTEDYVQGCGFSRPVVRRGRGYRRWPEPPGSGFGAYLVTDGTYGDFELTFEVKPDWPADTGILVRASEDGTRGFQMLLDYRKSGGIGGFYGNGIGGFHAVAHNVDVRRDAQAARSGSSKRIPPRLSSP